MKTLILRSALIGAVILLGGCGGSLSSNSSDTYDSSDYTTDTSDSDYTYDSNESDYGYTSETEDTFIDSCTSSGGSYSDCSCMFEYLKDNLSFSEFTRIDAEVSSGADVSDFPVLNDALYECV
jgi:hypothetical protein